MTRRRFRCAAVAGAFALVAAFAAVVAAVATRAPPNPIPAGRFYRFEGRAVFAEMAEEPSHSIYGSSIHVWVYRDTEGVIRDVVITGHAASKVCVRASVQLYQAAIDLDEEATHLLGAGVAHLRGLEGGERDKLQTLPAVQEYERAHTELIMLELLARFGFDLKSRIDELRTRIRALEGEEQVQRYRRGQTLGSLVGALTDCADQTGLIQVTEHPWAEAAQLRHEVERQVRLARSAGNDGVWLAMIPRSEGSAGTVPLPFYYLSPRQPLDDPFPVLTLEVPIQEFGDINRVLVAHLDAVISEVKAEAERRRAFAQARLDDARELKSYYEQALATGRLTEDEPITITHSIDWKTLRVVPLPEPEKMRLADYLREVLPGIISSAEWELRQIAELLDRVAAASQPTGRLAKLNRAIVIDSFLRDWDLAFLDETQARAYDAWRQNRRGHVWNLLDRQMRDAGVDPQAIKQENVVFAVEAAGNSVRLTPLYVTGGELLLVCDPKDGLVRYVEPWNLRNLSLLSEDSLPQPAKDALRGGNPGRARAVLAAPLVEKIVQAIGSGDYGAAGRSVKEALILDPRGTTAQLIAERRKYVPDTAAAFAAFRRKYQVLADDRSFVEALERGLRALAQNEYGESIANLEKAHALRPTIPDTLVWLALAHLWSRNEVLYRDWLSRAERLDRSFVRKVLEGLRMGELVESDQLRALRDRLQALTEDDRRAVQLLRHLQAGDERFGAGRWVEALWEYVDALKYNTQFIEPYQRIVDTYWTLGHYRYALEAACFSLRDPEFGLVLDQRPLRLLSPTLQFDSLASTGYKSATRLETNRHGRELIITVEGAPVLRIVANDAADAEALETAFGQMSPKQLSPVGETVADRILNTPFPLLPGERKLAEELFLAPGCGDLLLRALVYTGTKPSLLAESVAVATQPVPPGALLGTRLDTIWETRDIVTGVQYPKGNEEFRGIVELLADFYTLDGRPVRVVELTTDREILRAYEPATWWNRLRRWWASVMGRTVRSEPASITALPRGLSPQLVGQLAGGTLPGLIELSSHIREGFLHDKEALAKLDARLHSERPTVQILQLTIQGRQEYLLVKSEAGRVGVASLTDAARQLRMRFEPRAQDTGLETRHVVQLLTEEDRRILLNDVVLPIVKHLNPLLEGDRVVLQGLGEGGFVVVDLPSDPVLRKLVLYGLRGNPVVGVATGSTVADVEAKLAARLDPRKLVLAFSFPWSKMEMLPVDHVERLYGDFRESIAQISDVAQPLGIRVLDLSERSADEAKKVMGGVLAEPGSVVLAFWETLSPDSLELGQGGTFTPADLLVVPRAQDQLVAFAGCQGDAQGWTDAAVAHTGGLSFGFWENITLQQAVDFARRLIEEVKAGFPDKPALGPLLQRIVRELDLPGRLVGVEWTSGREAT